MTAYTRSAWEDPNQPVTGPAIDWSRITTIVIHYPGADWSTMDFDRDGMIDPDDTAQILRQMQASYLASRGYSLGYGIGHDQSGDRWEIRGWDIKNAANKGTDPNDNANNWTISLLLIVDEQDAASPAMIAAVHDSIRDAERMAGGELELCGHRDVDATTCPGEGIYAQLQNGTFSPPDDTGDDDDMTGLKRYRDRRYTNIFLLPTGLHLSGEADAAYAADGVPLIDGEHEPMLQGLLHINGLLPSALEPA